MPRERKKEESTMLRIQEVAMRLIRPGMEIMKEIGLHDPDLARQGRKALTSIPLNTAEGSGSRGGNRRARYDTALGSARELRTIVDVGKAAGYVRRERPAFDADLNHVTAVMVKLVK